MVNVVPQAPIHRFELTANNDFQNLHGLILLLLYCVSSANSGAIFLLSCGNVLYWLCAWAH